MGLPLVEIAACIFTYLVLGSAGYVLARKIKTPSSPWVWVLLIAGTLLAGYVGVGARVISIFQFAMYLNWCLQAFGIGVIIGFIVRIVRSKTAKS
jgi:hypothetical protein